MDQSDENTAVCEKHGLSEVETKLVESVAAGVPQDGTPAYFDWASAHYGIMPDKVARAKFVEKLVSDNFDWFGLKSSNGTVKALDYGAGTGFSSQVGSFAVDGNGRCSHILIIVDIEKVYGYANAVDETLLIGRKEEVNGSREVVAALKDVGMEDIAVIEDQDFSIEVGFLGQERKVHEKYFMVRAEKDEEDGD